MRLYGKNSVLERLRFFPQSIRKLYLEQRAGGLASIYKKAMQKKIPVISVPASKMIKMARNKNTQGVLADVDDFDYMDYEELLDVSLKKKKTLLFFDGLKDPQNLGAIIRSAACLGQFALIFPTHNSVEITESVLRVASGGDNFIIAAKVSNIVNAVKKAQDWGFRIAGTVVQNGTSIYEADLPFPLGIVIGSEQKGVRDVVRKNLDLQLTIPMCAGTLSFNAAQATTIFCYETCRQKEIKKIK